MKFREPPEVIEGDRWIPPPPNVHSQQDRNEQKMQAVSDAALAADKQRSGKVPFYLKRRMEKRTNKAAAPR